ncbi:MAG: peptide deformylase [Thermomicrobiales bacterium]
MALLSIVMEGDPRLRQKATKIRNADDSLRRLAKDMHETMEAAPGVGLAGPQVGVLRRIIVVRVPGEYDETDEADFVATLLNPEIVKSSGHVVAAEGCLSIPGWVGDVPRAETITVKAMDLDSRHVRIKATGWRARVLQHEIDHLDGILFLDRVEDIESLRKVEEVENDVEALPVGA